MIFSNKIDDNGVLIRTSGDKPGYFAVGFMSEKANGKYRYVWLFKVRAKPVTESYQTKEGKTITRQTGEVEWTAIKRTSDGRYQAIADEGENSFTVEMAATFLDTVYARYCAGAHGGTGADNGRAFRFPYEGSDGNEPDTGDESLTLPDYIYSTYNALMESGWRFHEIDQMDMLGFLRIRAWDARRDQKKRAPRRAFIDEVWPDVK